MKNNSRYDLLSFGILAFILTFSLIRFKYLPQFIDGYYHLSVANGFIKSGGWVGWAWWDFAPLGRPHLYPPLYHLILVFLKWAGLSGLDALRITEVLIVPVFFFTLWYVLRKLINDRFSFFSLLILSSFFPFYSSVSANVPASIAIIFGFLSWLSVKKRKILSATLFLTLAFYTHIAISWLFFIAYIFFALVNKEYRKAIFKILLFSLLLYLPLLWHILRYMSYLTIQIRQEAHYTRFSIFIVLLGMLSLFLNFTKKDFPIPLFVGYFLGSVAVFIKYPYRLFSAQGTIGLGLLSALLLERIFSKLKGWSKNLIIVCIGIFLLFSQATLCLKADKERFKFLDSTYYNVLAAKTDSLLEFQSLYSSKFYGPIVEVVKDNSQESDIIASNLSIGSQIFAALCDRPNLDSMLWEVSPMEPSVDYNQAKIIVWLKYILPKREDSLMIGQWRIIHENDIAYVFLNPDYSSFPRRLESKFNFLFIGLAFVFLLLLFIGQIVATGSSRH